jgi:hypothetical protein
MNAESQGMQEEADVGCSVILSDGIENHKMKFDLAGIRSTCQMR